jgi:hypothetical protein
MTAASGAGPASLPTQSLPNVSFADPVLARVVRHRVASVGAALVVAGVVTQVIAIVSATWWQAKIGGQEVSLRFADFGPRASRGFAFMYFSWGAWLVAGLTLGLGIAGCVRWQGAHAFRVLAALFAVLVALAPIVALLVFAYQAPEGPFEVVRDYSLGPYLAVLGTLATALGAAAGSAR